MKKENKVYLESSKKLEKMKKMIDEYVELELKNMRVEFEDELKRFEKRKEEEFEEKIKRLEEGYERKKEMLERKKRLRLERLENMEKSRVLNSIMEKFLEKFREHILSLSGSRRRKLIELMFREAMEEFGEGEFIVETLGEDVEILKELTDAKVIEGKEFGVILTSGDGKYRVVNTVNEFIEKRKNKIHEYVMEKVEGML